MYTVDHESAHLPTHPHILHSKWSWIWIHFRIFMFVQMPVSIEENLAILFIIHLLFKHCVIWLSINICPIFIVYQILHSLQGQHFHKNKLRLCGLVNYIIFTIAIGYMFNMQCIHVVQCWTDCFMTTRRWCTVRWNIQSLCKFSMNFFWAMD